MNFAKYAFFGHKNSTEISNEINNPEEQKQIQNLQKLPEFHLLFSLYAGESYPDRFQLTKFISDKLNESEYLNHIQIKNNFEIQKDQKRSEKDKNNKKRLV
jgi:hypothetical protein